MKKIICLFLVILLSLSACSAVFADSTWAYSKKADIPTMPANGVYAEVVNGKLYILYATYGTLYEYDLQKNEWLPKASMTKGRIGFGVASANGKIYVIGGQINSSLTKKVEEYDPNTDTWTTKTDMPTARVSLGVEAVDGKIYAIGGRDNYSNTKKVEEYNPSTDTWTTKNDMPSNRNSFGVVTANGKIYVIGGENYSCSDSSRMKKSIEVYNPSADTWITKNDMPVENQSVSLVTINNKIYMFGGMINGSGIYSYNRIMEYNINTDSWTTRGETLSNYRWGVTAVELNNNIYAIGGSDVSCNYQTVDSYNMLGQTVPNSPVNLKASSGDTQVSLSWDLVDGATNYVIKRSDNSGGPYDTTIGDVPENTFTDTGLTNGTTYYYVVTASNTAGVSGNSNEASATPNKPILKPGIPENIKAVGSDSMVNITWNSVSGAEKYYIYRSETSGGPYTKLLGEAVEASFTDTGLTNGTTYYYTITAVNIAGESDKSIEVSATPKQPLAKPTAPQNLTLTVNGTQAVLKWEAVSGATKYYIYKSETAGGNYTKVQTASDIIGTTFTDTGLSDGKVYYYVVTAANDAGESPYSNEMSAKINTTEETITVDTLKTEVNVGSEFTTDITLHNVVNMCAEDFKVSYNPELFEYVGYEEVTGLKVYKEIKSATPGTVRFIVASLGKANAINGDKVMVKLKFKAKKAGKDKIDVVKGRIANNGTIEKDILDANCGEKEITVKSALDVNRTGEFTLLDLGIDAWYYGDPVASTDTSKYDTDVVINSQVDNDDLLAIVAEMMNNTNYIPNN